MVEPVLAPATHATDEKPLSARLALAHSFEHDRAGSTTNDPWRPERETTNDPNGTQAPAAGTLRDHVAGTLLAHPVSPGHPMSESVAQAANVTIPATDRADQQPTPPPPPSVRPKLVVLRGLKIDAEYPIYEGRNTVGRFADKPVDIDLVCQESTEQIWCSRQHAAIVFERGNVLIEDLNSLNGTWVNGVRIHAGQPRLLRPGDVIQIGTVQMKLVLG
jgi:hypothetical protein